MRRKKRAPTLDVWSIVHFVFGIGFAIIGIPLLLIFFLGLGWEILEHNVLRALANTGGEEGMDNIVADVVLVFMGGAAWVLIFPLIS